MGNKVFVTGASGLLGKTLVKNLLKEGYDVLALVHENKLDIKPDPKLRLINGDITKLETFENEIKSADIIFHIAGIVTDWAPERLYYDVHVDGTKNIITAAVKHGIKKIIYISTIDIFAHENEVCISEASQFTKSHVPYRRSKLIAYKMILQAAIEYKINPIILCPSWIYGPGDKIFITEIVKQLKTKGFLYIGKKENFVPLIYTENISHIMIEIYKKGDFSGTSKTFLVSDINITWEKLVKNICDLIRFPYPSLSLPYTISYIIGFFMEVYGGLIKKKERPLLTRTSVEAVGKSIKIDTTKITHYMNYTPSINLDDGLRLTIESFDI